MIILLNRQENDEKKYKVELFFNMMVHPSYFFCFFSLSNWELAAGGKSSGVSTVKLSK